MARKKMDRQTKRLLKSEQVGIFEKSYEEELEAKRNQEVECLGMTFENDDARRDHFLGILREKLKDPAFRKIEGFPIGEDENILALSDPPYYTACPNPFIEDLIQHYGKRYDPEQPYSKEPLAADVSEGKNDPIYNAHSYHTKVPYKAIMRYILHYTDPDDVVFDGFCGTGMTGVAANLCSDRPTVESLRYKVQKDGTICQKELSNDGKTSWSPFSSIGHRHAILNDLCPAATFIAYNYNVPVSIKAFENAAQRILKEVEEECGWMYETLHSDGKTKGRVNYTVWSEVFSCPECAREIVFAKEAFDQKTKKVIKEFPCPHCKASLTKDSLVLLYESIFDPAIKKPTKQPKRIPVLINYNVGKLRFEKAPDIHDEEVLESISELQYRSEVPSVRIPDMHMMRVGRMKPSAITHLHHFFLPRPRQALAALWARAHQESDSRLRGMLLFFVEQAIWGMSVLARYVPTHYSQVNQYLSGVFYVASHIVDVSPWYILDGKLKRLAKAFSGTFSQRFPQNITTEDLATMRIPENSIDYIFTDPPFGENIYYSDLNFLVESWHGVRTAPEKEAIVDRVKEKTLHDYQLLMQGCFDLYFRALKPGRWITIEFHNSKNSVWNSIQESLQHAGFVVADVRTLDKKQGSFQQIVSGRSVKQDLVISAYKPNGGLENRFKLEAGTEDGVWDFIRTHLKQLPIFVSMNGKAEVIAERQNYLLFDRMVAFHVQRGVTVPLSASEFYVGLEQRFPPRDGMYFLPDQAADSDRQRMTVKEILQLQLFVTDEHSAIQWLKQQLTRKPQTFQEIHPQFMKEIGGWQKHEKALELSELLKENFLSYEGKGEVPSQIHSYLSTNFKELRKLPKEDPALRAKGKDRWYVPDPSKAGDLEKLRERTLLREFREYHESKQKRLKVFRLEAVRAGFKKAWQEKDYKTIIEVGKGAPGRSEITYVL
jgi:DNA modification methylase